jgi:hypothetical protein
MLFLQTQELLHLLEPFLQPQVANTLLPTSTPTAICMNTNIANCSATINCATETLPPLIISCVANKTLTGCSSVLGNYVAEVVAFDDCSFTVSQSPAAGTTITAVTQVTMTVTDQAGNISLCTFFVTPGTGGVSLTTTATTSVTCFGAATGAATVTPSGGSGTYTVTWMPGSLTGTVQTGLSANVYTVTATDGTCTATQNVTISQPASAVTVSLSASSNTICSNNSSYINTNRRKYLYIKSRFVNWHKFHSITKFKSNVYFNGNKCCRMCECKFSNNCYYSKHNPNGICFISE